eukprot:m51a1_g11122 adenosine deaminase, putative (348) ;mRNA; r:116776-118131
MASPVPMQAWLRALPKVELHHHLDGAVRPSTLADLLAAAALGPDGPSQQLPAYAQRCPARSLADFLARFGLVHAALGALRARDPRGHALTLRRVAREAVEDAREHNCVEACEAVLAGLRDAAERSAWPAVRVVLCGLWDVAGSVAEAVDVACALRARGSGALVVGVDVAGDEGSPRALVSAHAAAFARAESLGLGRTAHVGLGGSARVREVLCALRPQRLGHAYAAAGDAGLRAALAERCVHVECSATPAVVGDDGGYAARKLRAVAELVRDGAPCSLGTDDPAVKCATLDDEYEAVWAELQALGVGDGEARGLFVRVLVQSVAAAFAPDDVMQAVRARIAADGIVV